MLWLKPLGPVTTRSLSPTVARSIPEAFVYDTRSVKERPLRTSDRGLTGVGASGEAGVTNGGSTGVVSGVTCTRAA